MSNVIALAAAAHNARLEQAAALEAFRNRNKSNGDKDHDLLLSRCYKANKKFVEANEAWFNAELLAA